MGIFLTENAIKQGGNPHIRKTVLTAGTKGNMVRMQSRAALLLIVLSCLFDTA